MSAVKAIASSPAALLLLAGPAGAVTVKNTSGKEITIGINYGSQAKVAKVLRASRWASTVKRGAG